jgi:Flp pilus assembly protein TadD
VQLEHDGAIDIPPGDRDFLVTDDFHCPMDLTVLAVYPHAHYLATLMEGYATLPDGTRKWLVRIPKWDLNWQGVYRAKEPIFLPRGTVISMRYHYDNSSENVRNPSNPPKRVTVGNSATDEMGHLWLQVLPVGQGDQRAVLQEALMRQRLQKYPGDFSANFSLGALLLDQGDAAGAIPYFELAGNAQPDSALAVNELGVALLTAAKPLEAGQRFQRALQLDPKFTDARYNLASVEAAGGRYQPAATDFKQVLAEDPGNAKARQHLGEVLLLWGDELADAGTFDQAVLRYRESLAYRPADAELHTSLGMALAKLARLSEARSEFETALRINPRFQPARQALAAIEGR